MFRLSLALLVSILLLSTGYAANYSMIDLSNMRVATDINDNNQVVVNDAFTGGYVYDNGNFLDIGSLGGTNLDARGMNSSAQVVGNAQNVSGRMLAFLSENGNMVSLGALSSNEISQARQINDSGQIVGNSNLSSTIYHAFLYQNNTMIDLGTLGGDTSDAYDINNDGKIIGVSRNAAGAQRAFLYENGTMTDLGTLGGINSSADGINNVGQIVGRSATATGDNHAFLYENGTMTDLGTLSGSSYSHARDINDSGQIVGSSANHAFLYENGTMFDLNSYLTPDYNGWVLTDAIAINNYGDIVGYGYYGSSQRAFYLYNDDAIRGVTVPEPASFILLSISILSIIKKKFV